MRMSGNSPPRYRMRWRRASAISSACRVAPSLMSSPGSEARLGARPAGCQGSGCSSSRRAGGDAGGPDLDEPAALADRAEEAEQLVPARPRGIEVLGTLGRERGGRDEPVLAGHAHQSLRGEPRHPEAELEPGAAATPRVED